MGANLEPTDRCSTIQAGQAGCLPDLVEEQAARTPEHTAVIYKEKQLCYRDLNAAANQLARHLRTLDVDPNTLVGVCLSRSLELVTGVLGTLKAGGAYVPLDPEYPKDRLVATLNDASVDVLVTDARSAAALSPHVKYTVRVDRDWPSIARQSTGNLPSGAKAENLAYLMYTSGSTSQPKGVMVTHGNLSCHVSSISERLEISASDVSLLAASISFSASVRQYLVPLCRGACVVVVSNEELNDPLALMAAVKRHRVSLLHLVPPHLRTVVVALAQLEPGRKAELLDNRLRLVLTASEVLTPDVAASWLALEHHATLMNMYGLTETTGVFMFYPVGRTDLGSTIPIGRPMENARPYLFDDNFRPVPAGTPGELYLGGPLVARGYWNHQKRTDEKFVPDPSQRESGARLFRTGDRARIRPDGNLELLGRLDDEVKIRGFKVVPDEVRGALSQHPSIAETVVAGRAVPSGEKRLVAFVVPKPGATLRSPDLRSFLRERLSEHMVPSVFVKLDALPMLPNGKVDRRALPAFEEATPLVETEYVAPATAIEETLAEIWGAVFEIEQVGTRDNFFELGGDSLKAMEMFLQVRAKCGVELELHRIFDEPTVAELAQSIATLAGTNRAEA